MAFTAFVFFQMVNALCVRSEMSVFSRFSLTNGTLWSALGAVVVVQVLVVQVPFLQDIFGTVGLGATEWGWCIVTPLSLLVIEEVRKVVRSGPAPVVVASIPVEYGVPAIARRLDDRARVSHSSWSTTSSSSPPARARSACGSSPAGSVTRMCSCSTARSRPWVRPSVVTRRPGW